MRDRLLALLCCPYCEGALSLRDAVRAGDEVVDGTLECASCGRSYPVVGRIPRFVPAEKYVRSFGLQWNRFKRTQLDKFSGLTISRDRFFRATGWPADLAGQLVLDAGCGAGRFTEVTLTAGADVVAVDLSDAVEANLQNNDCERLQVVQADLYRLPFRRGSFDRVFCLGVIQHTPDPKAAFLALLPPLRPAGYLAMDVYADKDQGPHFYQHGFLAGWLRRYTTRMDPERLMRLIAFWVPILLPVKKFLRHWVPLGRRVNRIIPILYYYKKEHRLSPQQTLEWSILDTYDMYASQLEQRQRIETVERWFRESGLVETEVKYGPNGINGRGRHRA